MTLVTTTNLKDVLGIPAGTTFHDAALTIAVDQANDRVLRAIGQTALTTAARTDYPVVYNAAQSDVYLDRGPVVSITEVKNDNTVVAATDYRFNDETGLVRLLNPTISVSGRSLACWDSSIDGVEITYVYGYTSATIPAELKQAALGLSEFLYNRYGHGGRKHMRNRSLTLEMTADQLPPPIWAVLSRYEDAFHNR